VNRWASLKFLYSGWKNISYKITTKNVLRLQIKNDIDMVIFMD